MKSLPSSAASRIQKFREAFIKQLPAQLGVIWKMFDSLDRKQPTSEGLEEFHRSIHTLSGSSASFGLKALSAAAKEGERLAKEVMTGVIPPGSPWHGKMVDHLTRIKRAIGEIDSGKEPDTVGLDFAAAEAIHSGKDRKIVYLCEDDPFQLSSLTTQIGCFGFEVVAFQTLEKFHAAIRESVPDIIVMDMIHPGNRTGGAQIVKEIRAGEGRQVPVVYISSESDISSRLAAVRAGCDAYFVKPLNPTDLCSTLHTLTAGDKPEPYRVMIVDDDPHLSGMYDAILQEAGMETLPLNDPMLTLEHLGDFKPDIILMDMHMPGCNGLELSEVIRHMEAYISIPIVFLSSETDQTLQINAKRTGGDEFLLKPIKPEYLVSTVAARAHRMKLLRSFMIRDSLTGLFNHSATKEYLEINVERALRSEENVCFAMIDLDNFKGVNDRYGHQTGDRVLVAMASLLRQRLRKSDVIGRLGGEEFAVILPGISMQEAVVLMNQLRRCFETICFPVDGGSFSSTFSCGLASLESHDNAEKLSLAADQAMYTAKKEGRNRVVAADRFISKDQLKDMTVMVVDDALPIRAILTSLLGDVGFVNILEASNGQEAWEILKSCKVDLIIADWHMPKMNGIELLKSVRSDDAISTTPFVMATGESDKNSVREAILAGASEYILKPFFSEELSRKIIRALCKSRPSSQASV